RFFAYIVLRPSAGALDPPLRLALWQRVFSRFFPWVWASVVVLLATGYAMLILRFGGFRTAPLHVNVMQLSGIVMMVLFLHLFLAPWRRFFSRRAQQSLRRGRNGAQSDQAHRRDQSRDWAYHGNCGRERPILDLRREQSSYGARDQRLSEIAACGHVANQERRRQERSKRCGSG